jgi:hypothetical protein
MKLTESKLRSIIREELMKETYRKYEKHIGKTVRDVTLETAPRDPYEYLSIDFEDGTSMNVSGKELTA